MIRRNGNETRESMKIRATLNAYENRFMDDRERYKLVMRWSDLERTTPLSRRLAREDLDRVAYNHVPLCQCSRCNLGRSYHA